MSKENNLRDQIADSFVQSLNEDRLPWRSMWSSDRAYNATTEKDYRGINALWLSHVAGEKGYTDPRWCTYKQAADHGWQVRRGEKSTAIEFYSMYDTKTKKTLGFSEADAIISADPAREADMKVIAKRAYVFNAQQIDGIPKLAERETNVDIEAIKGQRDVLLTNMQLAFHEGGNRAYYNPSNDSMTMPASHTFESDYAYMAVLLHEAGHGTGHASRLNRDLGGQFGSASYAKEELRAEIASAFTAQALGFGAQTQELGEHMQNHKAYVQSWIQVIRDKPQELFAAIKDAEKISDYLIEKGEFKLPEKAAELKEPEPEKGKDVPKEQDDWREKMVARRQERKEQNKEQSKEHSYSR